MRFGSNKKLYLKRFLFAALIIGVAVLQSSTRVFLDFSSARAMLLVPLVVCISMHEKSLAALFFGVFAGILWDSASVTVGGFFTFCLAVSAFASAALVIFKMRNNIFTCLILSFAALFFCMTLYWTVFFAFSAQDAVSIYFSYYLPSVFYTMIFAPGFYYLTAAVSSFTAPEKKRINY